MESLWSALKQGLKRVKKPWQITGPTASPEFLDSVPNALEYRTISPATQPRGVIPQAETDRVFNIAYYTRERRRAPYTVNAKELDPSKPMNDEYQLPSPPIYTFGPMVHLDDTPGDGYQK